MKDTRFMVLHAVAVACLLSINPLSAVKITSIEQLDDLAVFSFSAFGDNNGRAAKNYDAWGDRNALGMSRLEPWIKNNDAFVLGVGDHGQGSRTVWFEMTEKDAYWHNHYYPVLGDNGNETSYFYGKTADQSHWGRGWVQFKALNNFFNRNTAKDRIEFRQPQSSPVYSYNSKSENTKVPYDDELVDYYARRYEGKFTFHIIGLNVPMPGVLAERSKNFLMNKIRNIGANKSNYDVVVVNAQRANWLQVAQSRGWISRSERNEVMETADLILCGDDHVYRRQSNFDNDYNGTEAIWMNIGQPAYNTGSGRGYLNFHMFDNPPRFSVQYILTEDNSTRKLHVNTIQRGSKQKSLPAEHMKPYLKYINGRYESINWNNFPHDGSTPPPPPENENPVVSFATPGGNVTVDEGSSLYVKVNASDSNGISRVYLYKDGVELARSEGGAPYEWNASGQNDPELKNLSASFLLTARAVDNTGKSSEASITVTVQGNTPPPSDSPVLSFSSPSGDVTVDEGDDLYIKVNASDSNGISRVYLYKDGVQLARSEGGAPYEWNASNQNDPELKNLSAGTFTLTARAVDNSGEEGEASITVTVNGSAPPPNNGPSVSFESPTVNDVINAGDDLYVKVNASDSDGVSRIWLYKDGVELARSEGAAPYEWGASNQNDPEISNLSAGSFTLTARAVDKLGNASESSIVVNVAGSSPPSGAPIVEFASPSANATVNEGANLYVKVNASDSDGVSRVRLYKDGVELKRSEGLAPYEWGAAGQNDPEISNLSASSFLLTARATDKNGNVGEASISVSVSGGSTPAPPPSSGSNNDSMFITWDVPSSIKAGSSFTVNVTWLNVGDSIWSRDSDHKSGSMGPRDNNTWGLNRGWMNSGDVAGPGESYTFELQCKAPTSPGLYNFQRQLVQERVQWFGEVSPNQVIEVTP